MIYRLYQILGVCLHLASVAAMKCKPTCTAAHVSCPLGSIYSPCFDSCYSTFRFNSFQWGYFEQLSVCMDDSHSNYFVPNSLRELHHVMAMKRADNYKLTDTFWLGIQDFARRGAGTANGTWTVPDEYKPDPDGIWQWMDGSGFMDISSMVTTPDGNGYVDPAKPWLVWKRRPAMGVDVIAFLQFDNATQSWLAYPASNFSTWRTAICENSRVCMSCPRGWVKVLDKCYQEWSETTYPMAFNTCARYNTSLMTPRHDSQFMFPRVKAMNLNSNFWIGLDNYMSSKDGRWRWASDGSEVSKADALDVLPGEPSEGGTHFLLQFETFDYFKSMANSLTGYSPGSNQTGWSAPDGKAMARFFCQQNAVDHLETLPEICKPRCAFTPACPPRYVYNPCFDSCYLVVNVQTPYLTALEDCRKAGGHLLVPNSQAELDFVLSLVPHLDYWAYVGYWLGLQDWARRGSGNVLNHLSAQNKYSGDPDGTWQWMDASGGLTNRSLTWLPWSRQPSLGLDFVSYFLYEYDDRAWKLFPGGDFSDERAYVCEVSNACSRCPSGWQRYLDSCYKLFDEAQNFSSAQATCAKSHSAVLSPKTENLLILSRLLVNKFAKNGETPWLGLQKSDETWQWADDPGISVDVRDALNIPDGEPSLDDNAMVMMPDQNSSELIYPREGFSADGSSPGWLGTSQTGQHPFFCTYPASSGLVTLVPPKMAKLQTSMSKASSTGSRGRTGTKVTWEPVVLNVKGLDRDRQGDSAFEVVEQTSSSASFGHTYYATVMAWLISRMTKTLL